MSNRKRADLAVEEKQAVLQWLLQHSKNGVPNRGAPKQAAGVFNISIDSVRKIWKHAKKQIERGEAVLFQNSPDTNINDLGFFRAIQSLKDEKNARTVNQLVEHVMNAYEELSAYSLNFVFLTLQTCLKEIMKERGGNNYKIPHMNKNRLQMMGILPECIQVEWEIVKDALDYLMQKEMEAGASYDIRQLKVVFGY